MSEQEPITNLSNPIEANSFSQFSEDCRIEKEGDVTWIYDPSNTKRWYIFRYTDHENKDRLTLSLQGQAGDAWHTLMEVNQAKDATTGKELSTWVEIDVIDGKSVRENDQAGSQMYFYDTKRGETLIEGWGGGFWQSQDVVERELQNHHPTAMTLDQLPRKIDVKATGLALIERFNEGRFDPPTFVLPTETLSTQQQRSIPSFVRRILGRKNSALQRL